MAFTIEKKIFTFERMVWVAIIIGIIFLLKTCGGSSQPNAFAEKMMKEKSEDSLQRIAERNQYKDSMKEIRGKMELQVLINKEHEKNLMILDARVDKLLAESEKFPAPIPFDSTSSIVSNEQIKQCIECKILLKEGRDSVRQYVYERDELDNLYKKDTALKGKHIAELEKSLEKADDIITRWSNKYAEDIRPKRHLYVGSKIAGMPTSIINQVGGMLNYLDKKGRMFTVGGGVQTQASWYAELGIGIRIF